jgi:twinkle protein
VDGQEEKCPVLSELHQNWLIKRKIDPDIAIRMGTYSASRGPDGSVISDPNGEIIAFPFVKDGEIVGHKYRGPHKTFWQQANGRKQFYNADILTDPALHDGSVPLVITEGEVDALAVATAGHPYVVSVPDGAPPPRDADGRTIIVPRTTDDIIPEADTKFGYITADWESLTKVRRIIIAVDNDDAGRRLGDELVRRLDRIRCSFVTFPDGCKDFNEVLVEYGDLTVRDIIAAAKPYPVDGVYKLSDFPEEDPIKTYTTGWGQLDEIFRPYLGAFVVVGGFPGHGKSTWTMQLATNMARLHGWNVAVASFEMRIVPYVTDTIMATYLQGPVAFAAPQNKRRAWQFVEEKFTFIAPDRSDNDTEHDIDWLLERMSVAVIREGARMVLIDPFNEIEHRKRHDESMTEYIGRAIKKLKGFAMQYNVLVCVVVHPTKASSHLDSEDLSLYSLADSSHWANKADMGVIVGRVGDPKVDVITGVYIKKIRYQPDAGTLGDAFLTFDKSTRLFS